MHIKAIQINTIYQNSYGWIFYLLWVVLIYVISELPQGLIQAIKTIQCGKNYRNTLGCFDQENTLGCNSIFKFKYITNIVEDHITWSKIIKSHQNNNLTKTIVFHNIFIRQQIWIFYFQKVKQSKGGSTRRGLGLCACIKRLLPSLQPYI